MVQLVVFHDRDGTHTDVAMASLYTYRSLMLFRIVKDAPLNFSDGRRFMQFLQSSLVIAGLHHPDAAGGPKYVELVADPAPPTGDVLRGSYELTDTERTRTRTRERRFIAALRMLGCVALRRMYPGYGSSAHLGGTLPFSTEDRPFTLAPDGRLHGTANVYVADGSGFRFLPAKGVTLTLMANAHRVAEAAGRP
jgi:choline dehydrogenase-like flavoprotein